MAEEQSKATEYVNHLYKTLVHCVKASNAIPSEDSDYFYHMKSQPFADSCRDVTKTCEELFAEILQIRKSQSKASVDVSDALKSWYNQNNNRSDEADEVQDVQAIERKYYMISDTVDSLLEEAENLLLNQTQKKAKDTDAQAITAEQRFKPKEQPKPQDNFEHLIDNSHEPFQSAKHPYLQIIRQLASVGAVTSTSTQKMTGKRKAPTHYQTPSRDYQWIDTLEGLERVKDKLEAKECERFAVDLEHHSERTFQGLTCLIQISTSSEDFIIDALKLRSKIPILAPVFADPEKLKILHGADMDILWLQRDFRIYIVNMFDTGQAARVLKYPGFSLAHLLSTHCHKNVDKQHQLADWRIRPIPEAMLRYAQQDTIDLIYVYEQMHRELITKGNDDNEMALLHEAQRRSNELCLQLYQKPTPSSRSVCLRFLKKATRSRFGSGSWSSNGDNEKFSEQQVNVLVALHKWRDDICRDLDESTGYVMPNAVLLKLSRSMPTDVKLLLNMVNPISDVLKSYVTEVVELILNAKAQTDPVNTEASEENKRKRSMMENNIDQQYKMTSTSRSKSLISATEELEKSTIQFGGWPKKARTAALVSVLQEEFQQRYRVIQ